MYIDENMHGRMLNSVQSYDLMDNPKYRNLEALLEAMKETFGYNQDLHGLVKASLSEANYMLTKKSIDFRRMIDNHNPPKGNLEAFRDSMESLTPLAGLAAPSPDYGTHHERQDYFGRGEEASNNNLAMNRTMEN